MSNKFYVAGVGFEIEANCVRWDEGPGYDAHQHRCVRPRRPCGSGVYPYTDQLDITRKSRYALRPALRGMGQSPTLDAAQGVIRQFIIHHDGCPDAASCFDVLHNERGLSCHFLLDNDGTIYQTLDLAYMGFHAGGFNANSIGIEMSNRGDAKRSPNFYRSRSQKRDVTTCRIHGHTYLAYEYTPAQLDALRALVRGLVRALPNMPIDYPQTSPGYQAWSEITNARSYAGLLGHYHTTRRKWDPGPFDFKAFCESVRGRLSFPIQVPGRKGPEVPQDAEELASAARELYKMNEERAGGGFFPVGPYGESRLWHGGVHLATEREAEVYTPFAGRVMAARMGGTSAVGSTNFVLMRHDLNVGQATIRFFSLYFHLADELGRQEGEGAPHWLQADAWKQGKGRGRIVLLNEPLEAGDLVGRVGLAGPDRQPQVHFEIFAADDVISQLPPSTVANPFTVVDGTSGGRFVRQKSILDSIDVAPKDGKLSRRELIDFFTSSGDRNLARYYATLNVSEWVAKPDWLESLKLAPDYEDLDEEELEAMVEDQVRPTLWWEDRVARHARLPRDGVVYHYHPISFVKHINEKLQEANVLADVGVGAFSPDEAKERPDDVLGDIDDVAGESFVSESELEEEDYGHDLTLEDLASGFPE